MGDFFKVIVFVLSPGLLLIGLSSCSQQEGPAEKAGQTVEQMTEKAGEAVEKAGEAVKETAGEMKEGAEEMAEKAPEN